MAKLKTTYNENDSWFHEEYLANKPNLCPTCDAVLLDESEHKSCGWFVINYTCPQCDYLHSHGEDIDC